jgi:hypothetical protein
MSRSIDKLGHLFGDGARFLLIAGVAGFFGFLLYEISKWLLFGEGQPVLAIACLALVIYLVFGLLPNWLSQFWRCSRREAERRVNLCLLFLVGACVGSYWIPANLRVGLAWYWRLVLGLGVGWLALALRRYR